LPHIPPPTTLSPGSIVDAYVRDSGGPRQDASTDQQIAEIQTYCQQHGLTLRHKYADVAKSGSSTAARDQFNNLIDSTRHEDRPAGILLWNFARFARDLDDAIYYKALLRNRNVIVHSLTDPIPEGQYGRIIEFFIDISNEEKRRQTSTDAKRGLRDLVLKHGCVPGNPPIGIKRQPKEIGTRRDGSAHLAHTWVPDPELVPRIKRAFEMRATGSTLRQIHSETHLYSSVNSYKTFFTNKIYIGILEFSDLVIENYCTPFVDMQTWNAVQKIVDEYAAARSSQRHPRRTQSPYLLSGLVYCDLCGSQMFGNTSTTKGRDEAYRCSRSRTKHDCPAKRISRTKLEEAVMYTLKQYILIPESISAIFDIQRTTIDRRAEDRNQRLTALTTEKKKLSTQIVNITRAIAERTHSPALLEKLTELETTRAQISAEIAQLSTVQYQPIPQMTDLELIDLSKNLIATLTTASPEAVKQILKSFILEIRAQRNDKEITGTITYFSPPPPNTGNPPANGGNPGGGDTPKKPLPIRHSPVGAPLYRQTFTHPIICPKKIPR
jgi:site-specific DNA recombinase